MPKLVNRQWLLAARPKGMVKPSDFSLREVPVTPPGDGEALVRNLYLAFEPAMRGWMEDRKGYIPPVPLGDVMRGMSVGQVIESNHPDYKPGDFVSGMLGWQEYALAGRGAMVSHLPAGATLTQPLSVLGITGITAYFGLLDVGKPQAGETVVVSGAAGATGSVAGQIAKLKGCRVVGIAGGAGQVPLAHRSRPTSTRRSTTGARTSASACARSVPTGSTSSSTTSGALRSTPCWSRSGCARESCCAARSRSTTPRSVPPGPEQLREPGDRCAAAWKASS